MDTRRKNEELRNTIVENLGPLIGEKVILTDLPYHGNIGDTLIWEGELSFFNMIKVKTISQTSANTFLFPDLTKDITICLHGGGNFGDLYSGEQEFRRSILERYPDNKIVIFPQSVWYEDERLIKVDSEVFSRHNDLHICARDSFSYEFLKKHFANNHVHLLPDMAFCIQDVERYKKGVDMVDVALFIKRLDKESASDTFPPVKGKYEQRDWQSFEGKNNIHRIFFGLTRRIQRVQNKSLKAILSRWADFIMAKVIKLQLIGQGVRLLEPYKKIYTTRLHGMILGLLLDKDVVALDNTTKKLSMYYYTWLKDDDNVKLYNS